MFDLLSLLDSFQDVKPTRIVSINWMAENHPEVLEEALKKAASIREQKKLEAIKLKREKLEESIREAKKALDEKLTNVKGLEADIAGMEQELKNL